MKELFKTSDGLRYCLTIFLAGLGLMAAFTISMSVFFLFILYIVVLWLGDILKAILGK